MRLVLMVLLLACVLFVSSPFVLAQNVSIQLVPVGGVDLTGALLSVQFENRSDSSNVFVERVLLSSNAALISLPEDFGRVLFIVDFLDTPTKDFFGEKAAVDLVPGGSVEVLVFPIGYVQGRVVDSADNLIAGAALSFECSHGFVVSYPTFSDAIGGFRVPNMPVGTCHVSATSGNNVGSLDISISRGIVSDAEVVLTQQVRHISWLWVVFGVVIFLLLVGGGWFWFRGRVVRKEVVRGQQSIKRIRKSVFRKGKVSNGTMKEMSISSNMGSSHSFSVSSQASIILETLSEKERKIAEYLISCGGESSAATIRHACHIPRTSLLRIISGLERKKLVSTEKMGKMVKVTLTSLISGKI